MLIQTYMHHIRFSRCICSRHHSNLKQLMTQYQLLQQQAEPGVYLHVYSAASGLCRDRYALGKLTLTHRLSRIALPTHKLCRSGLAALSLSGTVLSRHVSLRVWSRTRITLALLGCMVLISVNAILRLLKRSTCVRGRMHLEVCRYLPV